MERILCLDVGDRRIGVAVSDPLGLTAQPLGMIKRVGYGPDVRAILAYGDQYHTRRLLLGLPLHMDGTRGLQAEKVLAFGEKLREAGFILRYWDERMTTVTAEKALIEGGVRREDRRGVVDQVAAAIILTAYLDAQGADVPFPEEP